MFVINQFVISSVFRPIARYLTQISYVADFVAINCVAHGRFVVIVRNKAIAYVVKNSVIIVVAVKNVIVRVKHDKPFLSRYWGCLK